MQCHSQSLPAFSFSVIVSSCLDPPMHGGLLARLGLLLHCWGVLAWMARAWTHVLSSSRRDSFTSRWRCNRERPSNWGLTTRTLKWDSEPGGTACMWLSFITSRCSGLRSWVSLVRMVVSTGRGQLGSMWGRWWANCLDKARVQDEGRRQRRAQDSIRHRRSPAGKHEGSMTHFNLLNPDSHLAPQAQFAFLKSPSTYFWWNIAGMFKCFIRALFLLFIYVPS